MERGAKMVFHGRAIISEGTTLRADTNGALTFGDRYYCNANNYFRAGEGDTISFGDDCALGWSNIFNSTDGHDIWVDGKQSKKNGSIIVGNHVWITTRCTIGKNSTIADGCVVASNSVVTKSINEANCLIGGMPAKIIKNNIQWQK